MQHMSSSVFNNDISVASFSSFAAVPADWLLSILFKDISTSHMNKIRFEAPVRD